MREQVSSEPMAWVRCSERLPEFNRKVVAWLEGFQDHSGLSWRRGGFAFMVRHDTDEFTVHDKWALSFYDKALAELGADSLEVKYWMPLERPE